jgi:DNA-binding NarL/FixJ family response regulator
MPPIRVLLADDHTIVREGLRSLLRREGFMVVGEAADGHEAVALAQQVQPDVAVLDLKMPNLNGLEAARALQEVAPGCRLIVLSMHTGDAYVLEALRAGVKGYVLKSQAWADLVQAIREVLQDRTYLSPSMAQNVLTAFTSGNAIPEDPLTPREREVLKLVAQGHTTKQVGQILGIRFKTADSHRTRIMQKLNIHDTAGLVRYAIRQGLIEP